MDLIEGLYQEDEVQCHASWRLKEGRQIFQVIHSFEEDDERQHQEPDHSGGDGLQTHTGR